MSAWPSSATYPQTKNPRGYRGLHRSSDLLRGEDLNLRPSGYEPDELPGCSTAQAESSRVRGQVKGFEGLRGPCFWLFERPEWCRAAGRDRSARLVSSRSGCRRSGVRSAAVCSASSPRAAVGMDRRADKRLETAASPRTHLETWAGPSALAEAPESMRKSMRRSLMRSPIRPPWTPRRTRALQTLPAVLPMPRIPVVQGRA